MSEVFNTLSKIDVGDKIERKGQLNYLSWAWAWQQLKLNYPKATYKVYENENGLNYHHDNKTAWVKVGITVEEMEHIEYLPVLDYKNKSIYVDNITSFNVNTSIQRALTKAIARHGLGLYIYAGEDLPEDENGEKIKIYKTPSKQSQEDKEAYWNEFKSFCKSLDVEAMEFLTDWLNIELDNKKDIQTHVAKYLKDKEMFAEQLENFKYNKRNK